jgi:hypothetical protein
MGDSTLAGVVMFSGMGIVIFITGCCVIIFGETAHAAVVRPATINPVTAMDVTDFMFIVESPRSFGEASFNPPRSLFVLSELLHQFKITWFPGLIKPGL